MPTTGIITQEMASNRAKVMQTTLAGTRLRLLQDYTPAPGDNQAALVAHEASFAGYPVGGYTLTTWTGPGSVAGGGAVITAPVVNVVPSAANTLSNNISGFWVEAEIAGSPPSSVTYLAGSIQPPRVVGVPSDQFPLLVQDFEGLVASPS